MHVIPLDVIQSHISVPSDVITTALNPPPGNTIIAAVLFLPVGGKTVIVGEATSKTASEG
jgi:hypothetical protein